MTKESLTHADNLDAIKKIALNLFDENRLYKSENRLLHEQIKSLQDRIFGRKTEKAVKDDGQLSLFDIPEQEFSLSEELETPVASHTRKKNGRKPLP